MYLFLFALGFVIPNLVIVCYSFLAMAINLAFSYKNEQNYRKDLNLNILN